jgi:hypothetical protein
MGQIEIIIKIIAIAFLVTQLPEMIDIVNEFLKGFKRGLRVLLGLFKCLKCVSFWIGLIYTNDIFIAALIALIAFIIDNNLFSVRL